MVRHFSITAFHSTSGQTMLVRESGDRLIPDGPRLPPIRLWRRAGTLSCHLKAIGVIRARDLAEGQETHVEQLAMGACLLIS